MPAEEPCCFRTSLKAEAAPWRTLQSKIQLEHTYKKGAFQHECASAIPIYMHTSHCGLKRFLNISSQNQLNGHSSVWNWEKRIKHLESEKYFKWKGSTRCHTTNDTGDTISWQIACGKCWWLWIWWRVNTSPAKPGSQYDVGASVELGIILWKVYHVRSYPFSQIHSHVIGLRFCQL